MATELDAAVWSSPVPAAAVADSCGEAYFAVTEASWDEILPQLAPEMAALLAAPVAVSARPVAHA